MDLIVRVKEIKGHCPVCKVDDTFVLESGHRLVTEIPLCMHSLASLLPHYNALRVSKPKEWGLAGKDDNENESVCPMPRPNGIHGRWYCDLRNRPG